MVCVRHLLFFFRLNKVILQPSHGLQIFLLSMKALRVNLRKKLEKASVGAPCSEFYFTPFLLELPTSPLASLQRMVFRETLALKCHSNRDGKQSPTSPLPSSPLHRLIYSPWSAHIVKQRWDMHPLHSFITWQGPAAFWTCETEVNHKLVSASAIFSLCSHSPHSCEPKTPMGYCLAGLLLLLGQRLVCFWVLNLFLFHCLRETTSSSFELPGDESHRYCLSLQATMLHASWSRWISSHYGKEEYRNRDSFYFMASFGEGGILALKVVALDLQL